MPSTESEPCRPPIPLIPQLVDDMPSEQVADIRRNGWTACFGITGRHGPDYASGQINSQVVGDLHRVFVSYTHMLWLVAFPAELQ